MGEKFCLERNKEAKREEEEEKEEEKKEYGIYLFNPPASMRSIEVVFPSKLKTLAAAAYPLLPFYI